jgi:DNA polymerase-1
VVVFSSDSDLLPLTVAGGRSSAAPGGSTQKLHRRRRRREVPDPAAHLLYDFKAMTGEPGENMPGVPGIGLKRAADLLHKYGDLNSIIEVGKGGIEKYSRSSPSTKLNLVSRGCR